MKRLLCIVVLMNIACGVEPANVEKKDFPEIIVTNYSAMDMQDSYNSDTVWFFWEEDVDKAEVLMLSEEYDDIGLQVESLKATNSNKLGKKIGDSQRVSEWYDLYSSIQRKRIDVSKALKKFELDEKKFLNFQNKNLDQQAEINGLLVKKKLDLDVEKVKKPQDLDKIAELEESVELLETDLVSLAKSLEKKKRRLERRFKVYEKKDKQLRQMEKEIILLGAGDISFYEEMQVNMKQLSSLEQRAIENIEKIEKRVEFFDEKPSLQISIEQGEISISIGDWYCYSKDFENKFEEKFYIAEVKNLEFTRRGGKLEFYVDSPCASEKWNEYIFVELERVKQNQKRKRLQGNLKRCRSSHKDMPIDIELCESYGELTYGVVKLTGGL